mmetsp:Transcript_33517/g.107043  ORF Transcript_33517/g.107043 Transcript_33517/m.107043 type:complete len:377 (-) Transcript_33517:1861-2991(-)
MMSVLMTDARKNEDRSVGRWVDWMDGEHWQCSAGWEGASTDGALHFVEHPLLEALGVEDVVAGCDEVVAVRGEDELEADTALEAPFARGGGVVVVAAGGAALGVGARGSAESRRRRGGVVVVEVRRAADEGEAAELVLRDDAAHDGVPVVARVGGVFGAPPRARARARGGRRGADALFVGTAPPVVRAAALGGGDGGEGSAVVVPRREEAAGDEEAGAEFLLGLEEGDLGGLEEDQENAKTRSELVVLDDDRHEGVGVRVDVEGRHEARRGHAVEVGVVEGLGVLVARVPDDLRDPERVRREHHGPDVVPGGVDGAEGREEGEVELGVEDRQLPPRRGLHPEPLGIVGLEHHHDVPHLDDAENDQLKEGHRRERRE